MYQTLALYIDGQFIEDGRATQTVLNPATGQALAELPLATPEDVQRAIDAAQRAFDGWSRTAPLERSAILRRAAALARERAAEIGRDITLDQGKPLPEAIAEVSGSAEHAEWHAEEARRIYGRVIPARQANIRQFVVREPVGVCAAFTPWNFPFAQAIKKIAAALGAGCTLVLKGAEEAPSAVVALARIFHDAGVPPGVLNIVWGVPAQISEQLIAAPQVKKISFTGSVPVGRHLAELAGRQLKRVTLELGGHSPALVFDDADVEAAARNLAWFKIRNAGQICVSPSRFYVQENAYERFLATFVDTLAQVRIGNGFSEGVQLGPLANPRRLAAAEAFLADAREQGGTVIGGERPSGAEFGEGFFLTPATLIDLPASARILHEEPFLPLAPIQRFKDTDEVLQAANSLPYGLAAYVFSESLKTVQRVTAGLQSGMVAVNHLGIASAETPFGGVKDSGIGSEGGAETFDGYLTTKFITQA
ncbi:MAG: Alpha-ketoglutaric semialdehyde dehydrogenase [Pseudomonas citronellolis]|nr:MAG: Alpha-ketoglutaric semialdehyde dehydrogenase [Pseudomonas citronellolis]